MPAVVTFASESAHKVSVEEELDKHVMTCIICHEMLCPKAVLLAGSDADDTENMDIVPEGADPNNMLQKRGAEGGPPLEERGRTSDFAIATAAQVKTIKAMILEGIQFDAVDTAKQASTMCHACHWTCTACVVTFSREGPT